MERDVYEDLGFETASLEHLGYSQTYYAMATDVIL
jgi:hypothetical protein